MPLFSVVDIDEKLFDAAFALVRTAMPDVSAKQWSDYARNACAHGGLLGLVGAQGALFGFLSYRIGESLRHGQVFHIDHFVTFELSRSNPARRALCEAAEALARAHGCGTIEVRISGNNYAVCGTAKAHCWQELGHVLDGVVFAKRLQVPSVAGIGTLETAPAGKDYRPADRTCVPRPHL